MGLTMSGIWAKRKPAAVPPPLTFRRCYPRRSMRRFSISDLALARPVTASMILLAVLTLGAIGMLKMPLTYLPTAATSSCWVRVGITRTSPEVLERDVVRPLEEELAGVRGVQRLQVGTGSWGVRINLEFLPGTDTEARKVEIRDRVERVRPTLPEFVRNVEIGSGGRNEDPVMEMRIASGTDLSQDYYLIEEHIVRKIERVPGVARVELEGVKPHELEVAVDVEDAAKAGVSLDELGVAVRDARQGRSLGLIRNPARDLGVRAPANAAQPDVFGALPLRRGAERGSPAPTGDAATPGVMPTGPPERGFATLSEVAEVTVHPEEDRDGKTLNGRKAVNLEIFTSSGASTVEVTQAIRRAVAELDDDPALDGIELLVFEDHGAVILETLEDLRDTGLYGGLIGVLVLFLFLHRASTTFAASLSIPLSVTAASAVIFLQGGELSCIVLLALVLAVGMLIDNAVVIVEAIASHARRGASPAVAAREGAREVGFATIASTLSTVIVFLPLLFGAEGDRSAQYADVLGTTLMIVIVCSLLVSQTAVPLLMSRLLRARATPTRHTILDAVGRAYGWFITRTLRAPRLTVLLGLALAATAIVPAQPLIENAKLGPTEDQPDNLPIRFEVAGSRGFEEIGEHIAVAERELLAQREALGIRSVSCGWGDYWGNCRAYPDGRFESPQQYEAFKDRIGQALPQQIGVKYRLGERRDHWRENTDSHVVEFALRGEDMQKLLGLARDVADHLTETLVKGNREEEAPGTYDLITTPYSEGSTELHVVLDPVRLQRLGLSAEDISRRISLTFQGLPLGKTRGDRGEIELRLSADTTTGGDDAIPGLAKLRDLRVPLPDGREIVLSSVSEIELEKRPFWVQRVDRETEVKIQVRFFDDDQKANWDLVAAQMDQFQFPSGYSWGRGTMWRSQQEASMAMVINLALCLLLVYAVMASLFESFLQPMGILVTCILGCFGAPWAMWATDTPLDTMSMVGFFLLIGVVVNNGIMLVDRISQLRAKGLPRDEALAAAGRDRIRPILMTVSTTVLGLVPMLIHHPALAGVYYHSIAIVIAGGLTTSTLITLVFLPASYAMLEDFALGSRAVWRRVGPRAR
jgi:HAE1 family hydrophobic/amphiphilic exporter-1